jgi:predicted phosphodiesterase
LHEWVFRGHSHRHELDEIAGTRILNPGALGGRHPTGEERSVAMIDLETAKARFMVVKDHSAGH